MDSPPFPFSTTHNATLSADNVASVFRKFKYLCKLAYYSGSFPVRGLGILKSFNETPTVKKLSTPFVLSLTVGVFVKLCCYILVPDPITSSTTRDKSGESSGVNMSITDIATKMVGFLLIQAFGLFTHFLGIFRSMKFLPLAQLLENYLTLHPPKGLRLFNSWTMWSIFSSLFPLVHMTYWAYRVYSDKHEQVTFSSIAIFMGGSTTFPAWGYAIIYFVAFTLLEYSIVFFHIQILFPAISISKCLSALINEIDGKFQSSNIVQVFTTMNPKFADRKVKALSWSVADRGNHDRNFWPTLSSRYVEIEKIFVAYEDFVGPYLIASLAFSVVSFVCMFYVATMSVDMWTYQAFRGFVIHGTLSIASFRVSAVTTVGEMLKHKHGKLLRAAATKGDLIMTNQEKDEFENFIRLVKALPIKLSAAGYFTVGRKNVTSIISVIITYFIVLQQFKMSET